MSVCSCNGTAAYRKLAALLKDIEENISLDTVGYAEGATLRIESKDDILTLNFITNHPDNNLLLYKITDESKIHGKTQN